MIDASVKQHSISLYVNNKPGALVRISLVFTRRGYNITSLVVSEAHDPKFSHMNIVATGDEKTLEQILKQLNKLVDVIHAKDSTEADVLERELALIKVKCPPERSNELLECTLSYGCQAINIGQNTVTLQFTGKTEKLDALDKMCNSFGIVEMIRTGRILIARGDGHTA